MPKADDLSGDDFKATVGLLRKIIREENSIARGEVEKCEDNTDQINGLIDDRAIAGWTRKSLGKTMNDMRAPLRSRGEVGCFPDGREKTGPAGGAPGIERRMQELGLI